MVVHLTEPRLADVFARPSVQPCMTLTVSRGVDRGVRLGWQKPRAGPYKNVFYLFFEDRISIRVKDSRPKANENNRNLNAKL